MDCLCCGDEMVNYTVMTSHDHIEYDVCERCGSLWLDAGELDKMAYQVEGSIEFSSAEETERVSNRQCPRCEAQRLECVRFLGESDILLERCPNCGGFWLDGGELDLINRELEETMPVKGRGFSEFLNRVHLPYWYKRIRRPSSETDYHVELPPVPWAEKLGQSELSCPDDGETMDSYRAFGVTFAACATCGGLYLHLEKLRELKDRMTAGTWRSLRWLDEEMDAIQGASAIQTDRPCPADPGQNMLATVFGKSGLIVDWCTRCHGLWLERREFDLMVEYLQQELDEMSPDKLLRKFKEELKEVATGPEGPVDELRDAWSALAALVNMSVFDHPKLFRWLTSLPPV